ncbi:tRNA-dihydrouridine synthase, partial [Leptospira ellisii]
EIPPLRYEDVESIKRSFPDLLIEVNGGIKTIPEMRERLKTTDGVMIGRAAYETPYLFSKVDSIFFGEKDSPKSRREILDRMEEYVETRIVQSGTGKPHHALRAVLGLFHGEPGGKRFRRILTERMYSDYSANLLREAANELSASVLDAIPSSEENALPSFV